jgi:choline kinase
METNLNYTAVILAAGQGKRLRPLTENIPKCLIEINGLPIIHRQVGTLNDCGIKSFVIVTGFLEEKIKSYLFSTFPHLDFQFISNSRYAETNTLYSLALGLNTAKNDRHILQLNGDVVFDKGLIERLISEDEGKSFAATEFKLCGEEEVKVVLADDGSVISINKNVSPSRAVGEAVGINKFTPTFAASLASILKRLMHTYQNEYFEYALERAVDSGLKLYSIDIKPARAIEIDFPEDLERARKEFV